jgi:hypothetical protein
MEAAAWPAWRPIVSYITFRYDDDIGLTFGAPDFVAGPMLTAALRRLAERPPPLVIRVLRMGRACARSMSRRRLNGRRRPAGAQTFALSTSLRLFLKGTV